jgi:2,3-bisphosphoglycerate-dependent phosphoglycerate mutase
MGKLILARHHESEWNKLGRWTGTQDSHLTEYGFKKSEDMGLLISDLDIDLAFTSTLSRAIETLASMFKTSKHLDVTTERSATLNERDYGDYTGKDKWQMKALLGEEEFNKLRRGWDYPLPNGETLKMVYERSVPYFLETILPCLNEGKNVLVVAHGNSLRSLLKYIEGLSEEQIAETEFPFGAVVIYDVDEAGHMINKEVRITQSQVPA